MTRVEIVMRPAMRVLWWSTKRLGLEGQPKRPWQLRIEAAAWRLAGERDMARICRGMGPPW